MATMLRDSTVVRTRPPAIPLAMISMRKFIDGFPLLSHNMSMGLRLELRYEAKIYQMGLYRYAVLNTHELDMILQLKYVPIVMNPARIASSDWKS